MAGFFGEYEHSVDPKGRVILPAKFRTSFSERGGYVSLQHEGCLALWTPDEFDNRMAEMEEKARTGAMGRNEARVWAARSFQVDVDGQGRILIPPRLREFARLESEAPVIITGAIDRVELWDPQAWEERVQEQEQRYRDGDTQQEGVA